MSNTRFINAYFTTPRSIFSLPERVLEGAGQRWVMFPEQGLRDPSVDRGALLRDELRSFA
jgi:hypothetical protein